MPLLSDKARPMFSRVLTNDISHGAARESIVKELC